MNEMLLQLGKNAKDAETELRNITTNKKNEVLEAVAESSCRMYRTVTQCQCDRCRTRKGKPHAGRSGGPSAPYQRENRRNGRGTSSACVSRRSDR